MFEAKQVLFEDLERFEEIKERDACSRESANFFRGKYNYILQFKN